MKVSTYSKIFAIILVLGIPMIGIYLAYCGALVGDMVMLTIGMFMVLLFPIIITTGIMRKPRTGR
jgi:uncharacterized YccA/Bax inhibitor family protein